VTFQGGHCVPAQLVSDAGQQHLQQQQ
jgi:hypothetical protein